MQISHSIIRGGHAWDPVFHFLICRQFTFGFIASLYADIIFAAGVLVYKKINCFIFQLVFQLSVAGKYDM